MACPQGQHCRSPSNFVGACHSAGFFLLFFSDFENMFCLSYVRLGCCEVSAAENKVPSKFEAPGSPTTISSPQAQAVAPYLMREQGLTAVEATKALAAKWDATWPNDSRRALRFQCTL